MNKTSKLLLGLAALALGACSNDELVNPGIPEGVPAPGDVAYLNIRIISGDPGSRAASTNPDGMAYVDGVGDENSVDNAYFYFYDNAGNFVLESNSWTGGNEDDPDNVNVEFIGNGTVILKGLTGKNYPNWVVTVLNKPETFSAPQTLDGWKTATIQDSYSTVTVSGEKENRFVMTTSSYLGDDNKIGNTWYYFATKLNTENFLQELPTKEESTENTRVQIYVERLAARVGVTSALSNASNGVTYKENGKSYRLFRLDVSVAGNDNPDVGATGNSGTAASKVYIALTGWEIATTALRTNVVKVLDESWTPTTTFGSWSTWNHPDYHRSYWGKSYTYGDNMDGTLGLKLNSEYNYSELNQVITVNSSPKVQGTLTYCNENTNTYDNIVVDGKVSPKCATSVIVRAVICGEDGNPLTVVKYLGINWTVDGFLNKVLDKTRPEVYTRELDKTVKVDGVDVPVYKYTQISAANLIISSDGGNGKVKPILATKVLKKDESGKTLDPAVPENWEAVTFYTLGEEKQITDDAGSYVDYYEATEASVDDVNTELYKAVKGDSNEAYAATDGATYYAIPLEHLNNTDRATATDTNTLEGAYGVVRNHVYSLRITRIKSLGEFVFAPKEYYENGEPKEPEPIIPEDPKDPTFYVESNVNILSWKIVSQNVEL